MLLNNLAKTISLDGQWEFLAGDSDPCQEIEVPGCWEAQGHPKTLEGPVRYRRAFHLPTNWSGQSLQLEFGAVSYACTILINGCQVGVHQGMWTPFSFDITEVSRPGQMNEIEVEVIKPGLQHNSHYPMRSSLAGFLPDLATTFGGIWQPVLLRAMKTAINNLQIIADYDRRGVRVQCDAQAFCHTLNGAEWEVQILARKRAVASFHAPYQAGQPLSASLPLSHVKSWSPERPTLYTVQVSLYDQEHFLLAQISRLIGFRRLAAQGEHLLLNNKPFMVRGVLAWGWEPDRISPYYTLEQARQEMRRVRAMGFNCIKLCLFIPNSAYFQAADEEGILLWQEFPMWLPEVTPALRAQAPIEYANILDFVHQHPSVAIYSLGCEMNRSVDSLFLSQLNNVVRGRVHDSLVCDNSGSGESYGGLDLDFADFTDYHPYYDLHYFEPLLDHWRRDWQPPRPLIFGEFCDSDTLRDLDEIIQNNGGEPPWWMTDDNPVANWRPEAVALMTENQLLAEAGLQDKKADLIQISYAQAAIIRKYTLETLRRRRAMGGYIITGLRDTPISTSGVWDDLGRPKWPSTNFLVINGEDLLALDLDRRRAWQNGGDRPDRLDPFNFWAGSQAHWHVILNAAQHPYPASSIINWQLTSSDGVVFAHGEQISDRRIAAGQPARLGTITCTMPKTLLPVELLLSITLSRAGKRTVTNHWPIWVYPSPKSPPTELALYDPTGLLTGWADWIFQLPRVTPNGPSLSHQFLLSTTWDSRLACHVEAGARVLLIQSGEGPLPVRRCPFWREAIKFFQPHPLWDRFPHPGFTSMQFFGLASDLAFESSRLAQALPGQAVIYPLLRRLDAREFHLSDYLFEAHLGNGLMMGCSLSLAGGAGAQPFGFRRNVAGSALLHALIDYLAQPG